MNTLKEKEDYRVRYQRGYEWCKCTVEILKEMIKVPTVEAFEAFVAVSNYITRLFYI